MTEFVIERIEGVGVQCHSPEFAIKNERLRDIISLHCSSKEDEKSFWSRMEGMRAKGPSLWLPAGEIAIFYHRDVNLSASAVVEHIKAVERLMLEKGFVGFMLPEGILVISRKKKYIFEKFCRSLGLNTAT